MTTLLKVTTLKISPLSNPQIILYPDVDSRASVYLFVNVTNLHDTTLTWPGRISSYPWPCSAGGKGVNSIDRGAYILATGIEKACSGDACIDSTGAVGIRIGCAGDRDTCTSAIWAKSASVRGVEPGVGPRAMLG